MTIDYRHVADRSARCCWFQSAVFVWAAFFRKPRRHRHHHPHGHSPKPLPETRSESRKAGWLLFRKRHRHRHRHRELPRNPTLAETGGLPPVRTRVAAADLQPESCKRAGRSPAKAPRTWRWLSSCCPNPNATAMSALYAFCREVDDVADDESVAVETRRRATGRLARRRAPRLRQRHSAIPGQPRIAAGHPAIPSALRTFRRTAARRGDGPRHQALRHVTNSSNSTATASPRSSGLLSIEIFGYQNPACRDYAVYLGKALQLTNILRDVRADAERGRIYLPLSELARFQVREEEILRLEYSPRFAIWPQAWPGGRAISTGGPRDCSRPKTAAPWSRPN